MGWATRLRVVHAFKPGGKAFPPIPAPGHGAIAREGHHMNRRESNQPGATGEPAQAGGARAAGGGLGVDLSLGHLGTSGQESGNQRQEPLTSLPPLEGRGHVYIALCDACQVGLSEQLYVALEAVARPGQDPHCPRCGKQVWSFHPDTL